MNNQEDNGECLEPGEREKHTKIVYDLRQKLAGGTRETGGEKGEDEKVQIERWSKTVYVNPKIEREQNQQSGVIT